MGGERVKGLHAGKLMVAAFVINDFSGTTAPVAFLSLTGGTPSCHPKACCRQIIAEGGNSCLPWFPVELD